MHEDREHERQIHALIEHWRQALQDKDVDGRTAQYADDVVIFDVVNPTKFVGLPALKERLTQWFSTFDGPVDCAILEEHVSVDKGVAFSHSLQRFQGELVSGGRLDMLVRYTTCLRKMPDGWTVTHEHASTPFDPATGLASITSS